MGDTCNYDVMAVQKLNDSTENLGWLGAIAHTRNAPEHQEKDIC